MQSRKNGEVDSVSVKESQPHVKEKYDSSAKCEHEIFLNKQRQISLHTD